jgi:hypothetical protein
MGSTSKHRFDLLLRGGWVVDGSGGPPFRADLAVAGDRIAAIGRLAGADAAGRTGTGTGTGPGQRADAGRDPPDHVRAAARLARGAVAADDRLGSG